MSKTAIEKIGKEKCTGCFACSNICPVDRAIEMRLDVEGFYKPDITDKCIQCGKCQMVCPVINYKSENKLESFYGAWSLDKDILKNSSSGGIFSEYAKEVFKVKGKVYGAGWENGELKHMSIGSKEELYKLQGSKYIQSNVGDTYKLIKEDLENDIQVLFVGLACQVAGLYKFLGKEYCNLFTIDLVCHGVPSTKVFHKYVKELSDTKFIKTNFRDKSTGWIKYSQSYTFDKVNKIMLSKNKDIFFNGFLKNVYLNTPCYECQFRGTVNGDKRVADITLADFWGVPQELYNNLGVSLICINNKKGKTFFENIKSTIISKKVDIEVALKNNSSFYKNSIRNKNRDIFYKNIENYNMKELERKYFPQPSLFKRGLNFFKRLVRELLTKLGVLK